jgi:hypothetical protein
MNLDGIIEKIAANHFPGVKTLNTRKSDDLDFHDVSVWSIKSALSEAFFEGATYLPDYVEFIKLKSKK